MGQEQLCVVAEHHVTQRLELVHPVERVRVDDTLDRDVDVLELSDRRAAFFQVSPENRRLELRAAGMCEVRLEELFERKGFRLQRVKPDGGMTRSIGEVDAVDVLPAFRQG